MDTFSRRRFLQGLGGSLLLINGEVGFAQASERTDTPWWRGALFYELFVRSFFDSNGDGIGDFQGVITKLDHLRRAPKGRDDSLGIDAIWLMPIMASPSYHGYDVIDYELVNPEYGSNDDFVQLVSHLHERNMRVIIDFPVNHTSSEHSWFIEAASNPDSPFRDWYIFRNDNPGYLGPWGQQVWHKNPYGNDFYYGIFDSSMPDLNYHNTEVNTEIRRIAQFWLDEMGVDGFRMDAVKHMIELDQIQESTPDTIEWIREFQQFVLSVKPDAFTVGEVMGAGTDSLQPYYPDTLTTYFHFQMAQQIIGSANFGTKNRLTPVISHAQASIPDHRWATFLTNHDEPRAATVLKQNADKLKVAAMLLMTLPGTPFIYYGEEIGMPGNKPDPNIRTPMHWSSDTWAGFSTVAPYTNLQPDWESLNVEVQLADPESLLNVYRAWGQIRSNLPSLRTGEYVPLDTQARGLLAFLRVTEDETAIVTINLGGNPAPPELIQVELESGNTRSAITGELGSIIDKNGFMTPELPGRTGDVWLVTR